MWIDSGLPLPRTTYRPFRDVDVDSCECMVGVENVTRVSLQAFTSNVETIKPFWRAYVSNGLIGSWPTMFNPLFIGCLHPRWFAGFLPSGVPFLGTKWCKSWCPWYMIYSIYMSLQCIPVTSKSTWKVIIPTSVTAPGGPQERWAQDFVAQRMHLAQEAHECTVAEA